MKMEHENITQTSYVACKNRARKLVMERLRIYQPVIGVEFARVSIKDMSSRWGSCSSKNNLNFHYKIVFLPLELADYIIVHELCHLIEMNHSYRFWALVRKAIPDYRKRILEIRRVEKESFKEYQTRPRLRKRIRRVSAHTIIRRKLRALINLSF
ncbi:MAG: M48 family metallopeptidase [Candidatus Magasanikbacteria bacterium]|nr:M48 family metallopeptidase [Candidatus Magasanikbacteria bacterium]